MTSYTSRAQREGSWWIVQCDEVPGAISQVKRLNEAVDAQREAIAFVAGVPASEVEVSLVVTTAPQLDREIARLRALRAELDEREATASALSRSVARALEDSGYTVREIGITLGISPQRVSQLLKPEAQKKTA